jgi:hypothetical protein
MDSIKLWARNGEEVRQAIELGDLVHMETASEDLTDALLLFAIESGLLTTWAQAFPDPRLEPEIGMEVILPAHLAARFARLYSLCKTGDVLRSARVLGPLGSSVEVIETDSCIKSQCMHKNTKGLANISGLIHSGRQRHWYNLHQPWQCPSDPAFA